ncbi:MAG: hypothetical protein V7727_03315 [Sneathiella sp.]
MSWMIQKIRVLSKILPIIGLCACAPTYVAETYVWDVSKNSNLKDYFPERDAPPYEEMPDFRIDAFKRGLPKEKSFGLAFSGGGTRAATMASGQLQALHELGWMDRVQYISAVSGGSWAVIPYSYLPIKEGNCLSTTEWSREFDPDDKRFLGRYIHPSKLTWEIVDQEPSEHSLAGSISNSWLGAKTIWHLMSSPSDEAYANAVGDIFLKPHDLSENIGFFDAERHSFAREWQFVNHSKLSKEKFRFLRCGRPYPIVNATVITKGFNHTQKNLHPLEITPDYAGVRNRYNIPGEPMEIPGRFGGQYIQSYAYDLHERISVEGEGEFRKWTVRTGGNSGSFSLSDVIGVSGAAPQEILTQFGIGNIGFPEYHIAPRDQEAKIPKGDFYHGDGGHMENLGLMPLLARRVQNIIAFVNTRSPFNCPIDNCDQAISLNKEDEVMTKYLISFFREMKDKNDQLEKYGKNFVFEKGEEKLDQLVRAFAENKNNAEPLVHCDSYSITTNEYFGIYNVINYQPNICWMYLDRVGKWIDELKDEKLVEYATRKQRNFPHFRTFFPNLFKPSLVDLADAEVNLGSNLAAWSMCESAQYIKKELSLALIDIPNDTCGSAE